MSPFIHDLRFGLRMLAKNPGFTAVAIITLALGIGANTAIFSIVNSVLLRPLPYPDSNRLVVVAEKWSGGADAPSPPDFLDIEAQNHVFDQMAAYKDRGFSLAAGGNPEHVQGTVATTNTFSLLGVNPVMGRGFIPSDGGHAGNRAMILGYNLWQKSFGGRKDVLGKKLTLDAQPFTVVGIMPRWFQFPEGAELWVAPRYQVPAHPLRPEVNPATMRGSHYFDVIARLRPGVTLTNALADLTVVDKNIGRQHPDSDLNSDEGPSLVTLQEDEVGQVRPALLVLLGAVGLVLLIACANVANLLLARGTARRKEFAIRQALGASRVRVIRQLLTESVLLALLAGGLGILLAFWAFAPLSSLVPAELRDFAQLNLDTRLLEFTAIISIVAGFVFGLLPAMANSRRALNNNLKEGGRSSGSGHYRTQSILVVAETALALVLLVGAGLLLRSFLRLLSVPEGFNPSHVLTMRIALPNTSYPLAAQRAGFVKRMLENIQAQPGVVSTCVTTRLPLNNGSSARGIQIEGHSYSGDAQDESVVPNYSVASPGFFKTLQIPLVEGRDFTARDDAQAPGVFIINHTMARAFWPGRDPVGKRISLNEGGKWSEVVGVVGEVQQHRLGELPKPMLYAPYAQDPWPFMDIAVRTAVDPASMTTVVERAIQKIDKHQAVYDVQTMGEVVSRSVAPRRFDMLLLALFAVLALGLAAVGIFGVMSFVVSQRTHEIGIRMALGARGEDVLRLVVKQGLILTLAGVAVGLIGSFGLTRFLASLLFEVQPSDPVTLAAVSLILTGVSLTASYIPARRATKVDPVVALRNE
ncbi:MAG: ABC transporter permease [Terriglobia bacterium]